ncbi:hypothetical protein P43SY_006602 [Pythium insidiosum]|uniref:TKL protein kinase n=1 Tax=Pythium insidiosum TaxID=114742 RepID=A0AAD5LW77_PYTIN|nr:hypothetical protein P43SY_006602 [Pythium insidiosum]
MIIPLVIFRPYTDKFDFDSFNFQISYLYDDVWFANMVLENQQSSSISVPACKQPTRPWFASNYSCSVVRFNCHRYNVSSVTDAHLEIIEDLSVIALVFMHCPELRVPRHIQSFHNLLGIDIFNSTIVQWDESAAITNATHPILAYIIFVRVNMTALPDGVLNQLPDTATDFEITVSNLTTLPSDLHERWHPMSIFYFEHSPATEFPATLYYLQADDLSLIGTRIERLPEFESGHGFFTLAMTHTPLRELPASIGNLATIGFLNLGYTQLTRFPAWMETVSRTATKVYVHNTPFCASLSEEERARSYGPDAVLTCSEDGDRVDGKYPLAVMAPRREI